MTTVVFRIATLKDAVDIAPNLRDEDRGELKASSGKTVESSLIYSFLSSEMCFVATLAGNPIMIFGIARYSSDVGIPWMLGTDELPKQAKALLPVSAAVVDMFNAMFPVIFNMVDKRNKKSIRWLKWLGFSAAKEYPDFGVAKIPFIQFVRYIHV